jgi:hypothetical protein
MSKMAIAENVESFKADIKHGKLNTEEIFQKFLIDGPTYFFEKDKSSSKEYLIRSIIAEAFSVHIGDVLIIGSAKLGFSLKPQNLFKEFDSLYATTKLNKDKSDIDIAVVSDNLYENIGRKLYNFTGAYQNKWKANEYYSEEKAKQFPVPICYKYFEYYTKGWFRPDFKPQGFEFCSKGKYEELKGILYNNLNRKIGIAIYKDWFYFKDYHISNIDKLKLKINTQTI